MKKKKPTDKIIAMVRTLRNKRLVIIALISFVISTCGSFAVATYSQPKPIPVSTTAPSIEVRFSPKGGCADLLVQAINDAKKCIYVAAYEFSLPPVADALLDAHQRGVIIYILLDKSYYDKGMPVLEPLRKKERINIYVCKQTAYAHDKNLIIDIEHVTTGSFNFSERAENKNFENLMYIKNAPALAKKFYDHWHQGKKTKHIPVDEYDKQPKQHKKKPKKAKQRKQ